jgi:hypothetical protein
MAEFQWWLLLVGLVAGGGLVAVVSMDSRRREEDIGDLEQRAEATWIADQLSFLDAPIDAAMVEAVLHAHREYLSLQPPDRLVVEDEGPEEMDLADRDADREPDHIRDNGRRGPDQDLSPAAEQQAAARQEAHAGADREQRANR